MGYIEDLRKVVGNQPLILVGVAVAVVNEIGELLLPKRIDGQWGVPGGFIELGESTEEAGRREVNLARSFVSSSTKGRTVL